MAQQARTAPAKPYRGRFAPSPTGALHAGSLVAALASWLDARAHSGQWLVRMEDVDTPRCVAGADALILGQLAACGLLPDEPVVWQSRRSALYRGALDSLVAAGQAYPCACSRSDIEAALARQGIEPRRNAALVYPGTCREGLYGRPARAWRLNATDLVTTHQAGLVRRDLAPSPFGGRLGWGHGERHGMPPPHPPPTGEGVGKGPEQLPDFKENWHDPSVERSLFAISSEVNESLPDAPAPPIPTSWPVAAPCPDPVIGWFDRRLGPQQQDIATQVGDFVLKRADGLWAYQLAVVVDDAEQGITDIVRGADLADNTPRQILLQRALGLPTPRYLHTPLVLGAHGEKLSKQNGAQPLDTRDPLAALDAAASALGLAQRGGDLATALGEWIAQWRERWAIQ